MNLDLNVQRYVLSFNMFMWEEDIYIAWIAVDFGLVIQA
jgi:hypothetical protein